MSHSYKKHPYYKEHIPDGKHFSNRHVRRLESVKQYSGYKRTYRKWMVIEYKTYYPKHCADADDFSMKIWYKYYRKK